MAPRRACRVVIVVALLWFGSEAEAQEQTGSIEGVVRNAQGGVLPGATIEARHLAVSAVVGLVTDASGALTGAIEAASPSPRPTQTGFATVSGTVLDPMGGYVPKARIVLTDASGKARKSQADELGRYQFRKLSPGEYALAAHVMGFRGDPETVSVSGEDLRRDVTLRLAGVLETVTVRTVRPPMFEDAVGSSRAPVCGPPAGPDRPGGRVTPLLKIRHVVPPYPQHLHTDGLAGEVHLASVISAQGVPSQPEVVESTHPDLTRAAVEAMRQWRFAPAYLNCVAVPMDYEVTFVFRVTR